MQKNTNTAESSFIYSSSETTVSWTSWKKSLGGATPDLKKNDKHDDLYDEVEALLKAPLGFDLKSPFAV